MQIPTNQTKPIKRNLANQTVLPLAIFLEILCTICMKYPWNHCACNTPFDYGLFFLPGSGDKIGESCYSCPGSGVPRKGGPTVATLYLSPLYYIVLPLNFSAMHPIRAKKEINIAAKIHLGIPRLVTLEPFFLQINAMRRRNKYHKMMLHIIEIHIHINRDIKRIYWQEAMGSISLQQ